MNITESNLTCSRTHWLNTIFICFGIVVVFENFLVIVIILRHPRLRTITNIFVTSLAVTDAVVGLTILTYTAMLIIVHPTSTFLRYFNIIAANIGFGMVLCSYLHVAAIAIERYIYVGRPYSYFAYISEKFIFKLLLGFWTCIIAFILLAIFFGEKKDSCLLKDMITAEFAYVTYFLEILLLLITLLAYFKIAHISLKHRRSVAAQCSNVTGNPGDIAARFSSENWAAVCKTIRFYLIMTSSLAIMTIPVTVCALVDAVGQGVDGILFKYSYIRILPLVQSAFNFYINLFMSSDFRNALRQLFTMRHSWNNENNISH